MLKTITQVESGERGEEGVLMGSHPSETAPPLGEEQQLPPAESALRASRSASPADDADFGTSSAISDVTSTAGPASSSRGRVIRVICPIAMHWTVLSISAGEIKQMRTPAAARRSRRAPMESLPVSRYDLGWSMSGSCEKSASPVASATTPAAQDEMEEDPESALLSRPRD